MKYNCNVVLNYFVLQYDLDRTDRKLITKAKTGGLNKMIVMEDVYKKYSNGVVASNGINVEIPTGEFVYVVGPSGAGKSTFIKMMYCEERV